MRSSDVTAGNTIYASDVNKLRDDAYASSWLLAHEQTSPNLTLKVEEGKVYFGNTLVEYTGGNSASFTAPATNPRIDILSIDDTGALVRTAGTEAGSPTAPDVPAGNVPIAQIYNRVGQTSIKDTDDSTNGYVYKDIRKFIETKRKPVIKYYTNIFGDSSTRFDITNPSGTIFRYTYDGTGTNPNISATTVPTGTSLVINGQNFNASNNGTFLVTASGSNYFEITNASGVAENDKTLGTGSIKYNYVKNSLVNYIRVQCIGAGQSGEGNSSSPPGGAGGTGGSYCESFINTSTLSIDNTITIGLGGISNSSVGHNNGGDTSFSSLVVAKGGGSATSNVGDNIFDGVAGLAGNTGIGGEGGFTPFFSSRTSPNISTSRIINGNNYGGAGAGQRNAGESKGAGANGLIIVTEYY